MQNSATEIEAFITLKQAAKLIGVKYWVLLKAANRGEFPVYTVGNGRKRVLLSEVVKAIRDRAIYPGFETQLSFPFSVVGDANA